MDKGKDLEISDIYDDAVQSNDDNDNVQISNEAEKDDLDNTKEVAIVHVNRVQENQDVDVILIDSTFVVNDSDNIRSRDDEKICMNIPNKKDYEEGQVSEDEKN